MTHAKLVFVPIPSMGLLVSMVEMAKLLVERNPRLSIAVLVMKLPIDSDVDSYINWLATSVAATRIRFVHLPLENVDTEISSRKFFPRFIENNKAHVKRAVAELANSAGSTWRLAGFVLDMFCTTMIDLADELGVQSYVFFPLSAAFLGMMLHLQSLEDEQHVDIFELKDSAGELDLLSFTNPLPSKLLPSMFLVKEAVGLSLEHARRIRATQGIIINTFDELEPHAVRSLGGLGAPAVYALGPMLNLKGETKKKANGGGQGNDIMEWLNKQPPSSAVFLCFGSAGSFHEDQVKEMACALERSTHRFLWSLRQPLLKGKVEIPRDYVDPAEVLPKGGDVVIVVTADEIEGGIRKLMEGEEAEERTKKVKEVSEKSRKALVEGGSSYLSLGRLIEDILNNMP